MRLKIRVIYGERMEFILKSRMRGQKMCVPQLWAHFVRDGRKKKNKKKTLSHNKNLEVALSLEETQECSKKSLRI